MKHRQRFATLITLLLLFAAPACDRKPQEPAPAVSTPPAAEASASLTVRRQWEVEVATLKQKLEARMKTRRPRVAEAKLLGTGVPKGRRVRFRITNRGAKPLVWAQAWLFYYDADGKYLDRYPQAIEAKLAPGASVEKKLGYAGGDIPRGATRVECEISAVEWVDGSTWSNENLELADGREPGGLSDEQLLRREGEVVLGKWTGEYGKHQQPVFLLTNVAGRPLVINTIWTFYYAPDGEELDREMQRVTVAVPTAATVEFEGGDARQDMEKGTAGIEVAVSAAKFTDGAQESWRNENLSSTERRIRPQPHAQPMP